MSKGRRAGFRDHTYFTEDQVADRPATDLLTLREALANSLRVQVLEVLKDGETSLQDLACALGVSPGNAYYHVELLVHWGYIDHAPSETEGESAYRLTPRFVDHPAWSDLPQSLRGNVTALSLSAFTENGFQSFATGADRDKATLDWIGLKLDEVGWMQVKEIVDATWARLELVSEQSLQRQEVGGPPHSVVTTLAVLQARDLPGISSSAG